VFIERLSAESVSTYVSGFLWGEKFSFSKLSTDRRKEKKGKTSSAKND